MFLMLDSDADALLSNRRILYAENILTIPGEYKKLPRMSDIINLEAVILTNPYDPTIPQHLPYYAHTHYPKTPVVGFVQPLRRDPADITGYDILIDIDRPLHAIIEQLLIALSGYHHRDIADHKAGCARDHILSPHPTWSGNPFPLTPAERSIFRYLIDAYPRVVTANELLRYCMKPGTSPQHCNIATHIYHINQKARQEFRIPFIHCPGGIGYQLLV